MECGDRADSATRTGRRRSRAACACIALLLTIGVFSRAPVHAIELRLPDGGLSLTGGVTAWDVFRLDPDTPSERPSGVLDLRFDASRTDRFRLVAAIRGGFDGKIGDPHRGNPVLALDEVYQSKDVFLSIDEAYLELYPFLNVEVRIGKQKVSWGQLDDVQPTDHVNPEDLTEFYFRPELERKIGVPGIRVLGYRGSSTIDFVWNPIFTAYRFPARDDRWFPPLLTVADTLETPLGTIPVRTRYPDVDEPPHTLASSDVALRLRQFHEGIDMSLSVFHGWDKSPSFAASGTATVTPTGDPSAPVATAADVAVRPSLHRITVVGADLAVPFLWFALRAEAAWIHGRAFPLLLQNVARDPRLLGVVGAAAERVAQSGREETVDLPIAPIELERDALQYGIGFDWVVTEQVSRRLIGGESLAGTFVLVQLIENVIFDHDADFISQQVEHLLGSTIRQTFLDERLSLQLKAAYTPNHGDFFLWPELGYKLTSNLIGILEGRILGGSRTQPIGQYRDYDGIRVGLRWAF
ncbi:MAG: hypothetical protein ABIR79_03610 [Candidatus Binatia bacterium]